VPSTPDGMGSCQRLRPILLPWENLPAGGVFKNGARQPFLLSESQRSGQMLFTVTGSPIFTFVTQLFPKTKSHYEISGLDHQCGRDARATIAQSNRIRPGQTNRFLGGLVTCDR
jgi:hypothetical protein